jgi:membrane associated rhomboid family serine protease
MGTREDRKWKLVRYTVALVSVSILAGLASHLFGGRDNTTLVLGLFTALAGFVAEYFAANVAINRQKSESYRPELDNTREE